MRIIGIDPGLADLGYGIIEERDRKTHVVTFGVIQTSKADSTAERLDRIYRSLSAIISEHAPDEAAIEQLFFATNIKTAIAVAQARGVAILATAQSKIPLSEYSPPQIKLALVGSGRAGKMQVQLMVRALLGMKEIPQPDHAADALATALCHLHSIRSMHHQARVIDQREGSVLTEAALRNKALLAQQRPRRKR